MNLKEQRQITASPSSIFSGHGVYSPDGKILITSETNEAQDLGILAIRDSSTFKLLECIPSGGVFPHEMKFVDQNKLLVANGGSRSLVGANLAVIDLNSRKVLDTRIPPTLGPGIRHFVVDSSGNLIIATWLAGSNSESKVTAAQILSSRLESSASTKTIDLGKDFYKLATNESKQFLSVALHVETNRAVLTASGADLIVIVDSVAGSVLKVLPKVNPTSVSLCGDPNLMAISDAKGHLQFLDMHTLKWQKDRELTDSSLTGSHMAFIQIG